MKNNQENNQKVYQQMLKQAGAELGQAHVELCWANI